MKLLRLRLMPRALIVLLCLCLYGCRTPEEAAAAADLSIKTSTQLQQYYQGLIDDTLAIWDMTAFDSAVKQVEFGDEDRKLLNARKAELQKRIQLAQNLGTVAAKFQTLVTSKAPNDTATAVSSLGQTLQSLTALPKGPAITPLAAELSKELVQAVQLHKSADASAKLARIVEVVQTIVHDERPAYDSITRERALISSEVVRDLFSATLINPTPTLRDFINSTGLTPAPDLDSKASKAEMQKMELALLDRKTHELIYSSSNASAELENALHALDSALTQFAAGRPASLADAQAAVARIQTWLDLASAFRTTSPK